MGVGRRQEAIRAMRGQVWSPGRPSVAGREDRQRFWRAIAAGRSSEEAAATAGVSAAVGVRWFRDGGGMPPISLAPLSRRYLSFAEREEIAILHVPPQRVASGELRDLRAARASLCMPLRRRCVIRERMATRRRVAAQTPSRSSTPTDPAGERSRVPRRVGRAGSRSLPARQTTDTAPTRGPTR